VSSDFASTCAQLLPVFGLAAIAELVVFSRVMREWLEDRDGWRRPDYWLLLILPGLVVYVFWAWVIFRIADDELLCLDALRQVSIPPDSAAGVRGTIDAAITLLIVLPTMAVPLFWLLVILRKTARARALKRGPSYLDDEVELCIAAEPDYRLIPDKVNVAHSTRTRVAEGLSERESLEAPNPHPAMYSKARVFRLPQAVRRVSGMHRRSASQRQPTCHPDP
jgi:hypothetical protein